MLLQAICQLVNRIVLIGGVRSSYQRWSIKMGVLKNAAIFTGKHLCWSLFLIKLQTYAFNFIKIRRQHRCFPVNIPTFLRTAFFIELLWWLLPWSPNEKQHLNLSRPEVVKIYYEYMGGVDKLDFLISLYRINAKTKK